MECLGVWSFSGAEKPFLGRVVASTGEVWRFGQLPVGGFIVDFSRLQSDHRMVPRSWTVQRHVKWKAEKWFK